MRTQSLRFLATGGQRKSALTRTTPITKSCHLSADSRGSSWIVSAEKSGTSYATKATMTSMWHTAKSGAARKEALTGLLSVRTRL